ncbi:hypothetical protein HDU89_007699 [Geranomyces variabilis]|nr:hypothetical protein HDU89_007699 [Geranomyces variabilis]
MLQLRAIDHVPSYDDEPYEDERSDRILYDYWISFATSDPHIAQVCSITTGNWYILNNNEEFAHKIRILLCDMAAEVLSTDPLPYTPLPPWVWSRWIAALIGEQWYKAPNPQITGPPQFDKPAKFLPIPTVTDLTLVRQTLTAHMFATGAFKTGDVRFVNFQSPFRKVMERLRPHYKALCNQLGEEMPPFDFEPSWPAADGDPSTSD